MALPPGYGCAHPSSRAVWDRQRRRFVQGHGARCPMWQTLGVHPFFWSLQQGSINWSPPPTAAQTRLWVRDLLKPSQLAEAGLRLKPLSPRACLSSRRTAGREGTGQVTSSEALFPLWEMRLVVPSASSCALPRRAHDNNNIPVSLFISPALSEGGMDMREDCKPPT